MAVGIERDPPRVITDDGPDVKVEQALARLSAVIYRLVQRIDANEQRAVRAAHEEEDAS